MKNTTITTPNTESPDPEKQKQFDEDLRCIAHAWPKLSANVQQTIRTLVATFYPDGKDSHNDNLQ